MSKSGISWCDEVLNPIVGCTPASTGCANCFASDLHNKRHEAYNNGKLQNIPQYAKPFSEIQFIEKRLQIAIRRRKPTTYFVNSVSDLFHKDVTFEQIMKVMDMIHGCDWHTFIILTKRPERMLEYLQYEESVHVEDTINYDHVYFGVSVEDQESFDKRVPILLETPVTNKILSIEPLVGEIDMSTQIGCLEGWRVEPEHTENCDPERGCFSDCPQPVQVQCDPIKAVIIGGESGKNARPCEYPWIKKITQQCDNGNVPVYLKQLGSHLAKSLNLDTRNGDNPEQYWSSVAKYGDVNNLPWSLNK